ncbi:transposase [Klosneuvirus KNV1]|uniref:Transposase n=1 Tax=Klosneuvirus KNV1 TaxID=1977640 RepID=A0A1V0SLQ8_9VIRU|nr:transposase [Klosneuvirus KNV1]
MNFDIKTELKNIILKTDLFKNTFSNKHTNSKYSIDLIINELLYFLQSGVSWRSLRSPINSKTLFWHYSRFVKNNIFLKLFKKIKHTYVHKYICDQPSLLIDSTIIYNKFGINKIGRNKFYKNKKTTKISLMTDINGFPLSVLFLKGNYHDNSVFNKHIRDTLLILPNKKIKIIADKAYSSKNNYTLLDSHNLLHIIPPRKNMKIANDYKYEKNEYIKRIKIEHIFARLKTYKRLNLRYDKWLRNYSGFVYLALSLISINIFNKCN